MKKLLAFTLALALVFSLSACSKGTANSAPATGAASGSPASTTESAGQKFGYTCMDLTNPFQIAMRDAVQQVVKEKGGTLVSIDGAADQTKQNNAIEDMITQGIKVLFLNPVDSKGVKPALQACKAAGVKVIVLDSNVADTDLTETFISSNNYQAGKLCGEEMVKLYPNGAKLCIIENPLAESVVQRVKGLQDAINGSNIKLVDRKSISSMDKVLSSAEDLLQAHPDVNIFWGLNDDVSLIVQGAVESAGIAKQVKVFSVDGSPSGKKSIAKGGVYLTAAQSPVSIGKKGAECAYDILAGKTVEKTYSIDTSIVNADNVKTVGSDNWA